MLSLIQRDVALAWRAGGAMLPVVFFLLVATLIAFAVGPDAPLLARIGGGVLWMAALLAALLPVDRLIEPDRLAGTLDQLTVRGHSDESIAGAKLAAHWLSFGPPLMLAVFPAAALLRLSGDAVWRLEVGLVVGTPALAALALTVSALTAGLRGAGALGGLLMLPLAVPVLIFGAGTLGDDNSSALKLLAAVSLVLVAGAPFAAGAAIRAART